MVSLQLAPLVRPTLRSARGCSQRPLAQRCLTTTHARAAEISSEAATSSTPAADPSAQGSRDAPAAETYKQFLERIAYRYREAQPLNWLSETPFPMNPSFRPPPPISDLQRETMYREYMSDPVKNNVRMLSQKYGLSIKRVDAILRLKGHERAWTKGKQLQTGFQAGMELLLRATTHKAASQADRRYDVHEADILEQDENRDAMRQRYQRAYWESVPEGSSEPIVPRSLEHAREKAKDWARKAEEFKSIPQLLQRVPDTPWMKRPTEKVILREREGRPSLRFIDVGTKFMDVDQRVKQLARAGRAVTRRRAAATAAREQWKAERAKATA
ncbi:hypothetical protein CC1G_00544 [Coprinopsis cinerea okayama7|uniref:Uncharacterized protein n=1 Tax=Coprinopsis cinerea (strain Okayama-7 / 130 / ATCC MYA-4618 / FGSC 9003) TaxID=240176 RepID=A8N3C0_COPC7|nr:hypothetical protein CC1G_00544 [Coprinopsis cinerea okayama7\|eukprot:XP_001829365.1 hypothetical protein CC1G_00544 [Coprinopsis cinerea okayama7\